MKLVPTYTATAWTATVQCREEALQDNYRAGCRAVAKTWLEIYDALRETDPAMAGFALDRACANYNESNQYN